MKTKDVFGCTQRAACGMSGGLFIIMVSVCTLMGCQRSQLDARQELPLETSVSGGAMEEDMWHDMSPDLEGGVAQDEVTRQDTVVWPELDMEFVLHHEDETVSSDDSQFPRSTYNYIRTQMTLYPAPIGVRSRSDLQLDGHGDLLGYEPLYVGHTMKESDGKYHLYRCDDTTALRVYVRPDVYIKCFEPGGISIKVKQGEDETGRTFEDPCSHEPKNVPDLPEIWIERFLALYEPEGLTFGEVAYLPSIKTRVHVPYVNRRYDYSHPKSCGFYQTPKQTRGEEYTIWEDNK